MIKKENNLGSTNRAIFRHCANSIQEIHELLGGWHNHDVYTPIQSQGPLVPIC